MKKLTKAGMRKKLQLIENEINYRNNYIRRQRASIIEKLNL